MFHPSSLNDWISPAKFHQATVNVSAALDIFMFFKEINTSIFLECNKWIKNDCKYIYIVTNESLVILIAF